MATEYRNNTKVNVVTRRWRARTNLTPLRTQNYSAWRQASHLAACSCTPGSINLNRLHDVFQVAMGWTDSHLHQFVDAPIVYAVPSDDDYPGEERLDERRFRLADVARHEKRPLFMNTILATAGRMKQWSRRPCPLTLKRSMRFAWMGRTPVRRKTVAAFEAATNS